MGRRFGRVDRGLDEARANAAGSFVIIAAQRLARIAVIVPAAAFLDGPSFAAVVLALAIGDISRSALHGFDVSMVRELSGSESPRAVVATHLGGKVCVGSVVAVALIALPAVVYGPDVAALTAIGLAGLLPANLGGLLAVERQASLRLASVAPYAVGASLVGVVLGVAGTILLRDATATVAGLAIGDATFFVVMWLVAGRPLPRWSGVGSLLGRIPALTVTQLGYVAQGRIGVILLGALAAPHVVAEFGIAARVTEGLIVFAVALTASSYPLMARAVIEDDLAAAASILAASGRVALFVASALLALLGVTAPLWLTLLFPRYPGTILPFALMGVAVVLFFASSQTTAFLNASRRDGIAAASSLAGFVGATLVTLVLLPAGTIGAAMGRVVGEAVRLVVEVIAADRTAPGVLRALAPAVLVAVGVVGAAAGAGLTGRWEAMAGVSVVLVIVGATAGRRVRWARNPTPRAVDSYAAMSE